jgi:hypothetical protein
MLLLLESQNGVLHAPLEVQNRVLWAVAHIALLGAELDSRKHVPYRAESRAFGLRSEAAERACVGSDHPLGRDSTGNP